MAPIKQTVFVVEDDPSVRKALALLIQSVGLDVRTYESGFGFLGEYDPSVPGCLILDLRMPKLSGLEVQQELLTRGIDLPIVFITGHGDVKVAVQALKRGAVDFVEKPFSDQLLLDAVQRAIELDCEARARHAGVQDMEVRLSALTPREREITEMVVDGKASKQIARELDISQKTVEVHRSHIMKKVKARCVADLVRMVLAVRTASLAPSAIRVPEPARRHEAFRAKSARHEPATF